MLQWLVITRESVLEAETCVSRIFVRTNINLISPCKMQCVITIAKDQGQITMRNTPALTTTR